MLDMIQSSLDAIRYHLESSNVTAVSVHPDDPEHAQSPALLSLIQLREVCADAQKVESDWAIEAIARFVAEKYDSLREQSHLIRNWHLIEEDLEAIRDAVQKDLL